MKRLKSSVLQSSAPWFKLIILLMALGVVIFAVIRLRPIPVENPILGTSERHSWCPADVQILRLVANNVAFSEAADLEDFCRISWQNLDTDLLAQARFAPLMEARGLTGDPVLLEGDLEKGLFRSQKLPFRSIELKERLKARGLP